MDRPPPTTSNEPGVAAQGSTGIRSGRPRRGRRCRSADDHADGRPGSGCYRRPPRGSSRIDRQRPSELDRSSAAPAPRSTSSAATAGPGAVAPSAPSWRGKRGQQVRRWLERRGRRAVRPRPAQPAQSGPARVSWFGFHPRTPPGAEPVCGSRTGTPGQRRSACQRTGGQAWPCTPRRRSAPVDRITPYQTQEESSHHHRGGTCRPCRATPPTGGA